MSALNAYGASYSDALINCFNKFSATYNSINTGRLLAQLLRAFGAFGAVNQFDFSNPRTFYATIFDFRRYWYTTTTNKTSVVNRNWRWYLFLQFVRFCIEESVFPPSALPPGNPKLLRRDIVGGGKGSESAAISSLVHIDLARSDEEYLDELEQQLRTASDAFLSCALKEIEISRAAFLEGAALLERTTHERLSKQIEDSFQAGHPYREQILTNHGVRWVNIFSPRNPHFKENTLTYITHRMGGLILGRHRKGTSIDPAIQRAYMGMSSNQMAGLLGVLTSRRAVPFFVYLLIKEPRITVEALLEAEVSDRDGTTVIMSPAGEDGTAQRMQVKKRRAHAVKSELLDDEAKSVLTLLVRFTQPCRDYLRAAGSPHCNKLWAVVESGGKAPRWMSGRGLWAIFGRDVKKLDDPTLHQIPRKIAEGSFLNCHPELRPYVPFAQLRLLRVTQGLLTWFESGGDIDKVARTLGNTKKISLRHYIPKILQTILYKRIIRRYQNLLIAAATVDEPYLLQATDFSSLDALHMFLAQSLLHEGHLQQQLEKALKPKYTPNNDGTTEIQLDSDTKVRVSISVSNLTVLFLYQEHVDSVYRSDLQRGVKDHVVGLTPAFWVALARILHRSLPTDPSRREFHAIYSDAVRRCGDLRGTMKFPTLRAAGPQAS